MEKQPLSGGYGPDDLPPPYPGDGYQSLPPTQPPTVHRITVIEDMEVDDPKDPNPSMLCPLLLSCWVFWCCSPLFGALAFFVACLGRGAYTQVEAWRLRTISMALSITGVIVTVIVGLILVSLHMTVGLWQRNAV